MKNEHDKANEKPAPAATPPAPAPTRAAAAPAPTPAAPAPQLPSSTTAVAEELPAARPTPSEQDRKAAEARLAPMVAEYESLAEQTRLARGDPAKLNPLLARKGEVTRQIDALKRANRLP